jgi:hypothetical protein
LLCVPIPNDLCPDAVEGDAVLLHA